jgi:YVTN family beta-propeller protein
MRSNRRGLQLTLVVVLGATLRAEPEKVPAYPPDAGSKRARYAVPEDDLYKSPVNLAVSGDGRSLYIVCEDSDELLRVDTAAGTVAEALHVGRWPFGIASSPDGKILYVSNREGDSVSVIGAGEEGGKLRILKTVPTGDSPHGLVTDASGDVLYVANMYTDDVSLIDTKTFKELKRLSAGRYPFEMTRSPDGKRVYVSSQASVPVPFRTPSAIEITFIDTEKRVVADRRLLKSTVIAQGISVTPDSKFVVVGLALPKNLLPETQILQGWMVTWGFAVLEAEEWGRSAFLLLDEPHLYYSDPFGVQISRDGRHLYISSSGADMVSVVDFARAAEILKLQDGKIGITDEEIDRFSRHLGLSSEHVVARIPTGDNPKGLALSPDGRTLYVAERLADKVSLFSTQSCKPAGEMHLGGPEIVTTLRRGARLFNNATVSFQKQLSCTTCHPESHLDGLTYDIGLDGIGRNLVDNRTMRGIADTGPFKWNGKNPTIHRQEGPRAAMLFFRSHGFEEEDTQAVVSFIESLPLADNRFRPKAGQKPTEVQRKGKKYFERSMTTDGRHIPVGNRCITCHPPPYYTDNLKHDVGTRGTHDTDGEFDTPQLNNIHLQAPYLHDGRCYTLEEIWTRFNPDDTHGQTNDMTKEMLNDLIEYLKTF